MACKPGLRPICCTEDRTDVMMAGLGGRGRRLRRALMMSVAVVAVAGGQLPGQPGIAVARAAERGYAVPAGPLAQALQVFGQQSGLQISYIPSLAAGRTSPGVTGEMDAIQALVALLEGTGVDFRTGEGGLVTLVPAADQGQESRAQKLDPVVVISALTDIRTIATSTVDRETIERLQANSVPELLNDLPGVDLVGSARPDGHSLNIWGFGDQEDVAITLDGADKSFEKYRQGTVFIEPELVKEITVDKGSFSPRGYGAFGGTVALTTKSASDMLLPGENIGGFLKLGYGVNGKEWSRTTALFGRDDDIGAELLVSATRRDNDKYRTADGQKLNLSEGELLSGHFKGSVAREDHFLELSGAMSTSDVLGPFAAKTGQIVPSDYQIDRYGFEQALARLTVRRQTDDRSLSGKYVYDPVDPLVRTTVQLSWSETKQHDKRQVEDIYVNLGLGGNESWLSYENYGAEIYNESRFALGGLETTLSIGAQVKHQDRDSMAYSWTDRNDPDRNYGHLQPYNIPAGTQTIYAGWMEYEVDFGNGLTVTPGLRYDRIRTDGVPNAAADYSDPAKGHDYSAVVHKGFSPTLNALYQVNDNLALFGGLAYKLRAPLVDEIYEVGTNRSSARQLEAERAFEKRIGAVLTFGDVLEPKDKVLTRLQIYRNDVSDNIMRVFGSPNVDRYPDRVPSHHNLRGFHTQGVELEAFYDSPLYIAGLSLAYAEGEHEGSVRDIYGADQPVYDIAPFKLVAQFGRKIPEYDLLVGWKGLFVAGQDDIPDDALIPYSPYPASAGYGVHDVYVSWTPRDGLFGGATARLTVQNLFDKDYKAYFNGFSAKGRSVKAAVAYTF